MPVRFIFSARSAGLIFGTAALIAFTACGGGGQTGTSIAPSLSATPVPAAPVPATSSPATTVPTAIVTPTSTPSPVQIQDQATQTPQPTIPVTKDPSTPAPTAPITVLPTRLTDYGFGLTFERGADVQILGDASPEQGSLSFLYGEVDVVVIWLAQGDSLLALASGVFELVKASLPDLAFDVLAEGEILVDGEPGFYLGFEAGNASAVLSGGLIGSWACGASGTAYTLSLTGTDRALVQIRFDELLDNFSCVAS